MANIFLQILRALNTVKHENFACILILRISRGEPIRKIFMHVKILPFSSCDLPTGRPCPICKTRIVLGLHKHIITKPKNTLSCKQQPIFEGPQIINKSNLHLLDLELAITKKKIVFSLNKISMKPYMAVRFFPRPFLTAPFQYTRVRIAFSITSHLLFSLDICIRNNNITFCQGIR